MNALVGVDWLKGDDVESLIVATPRIRGYSCVLLTSLVFFQRHFLLVAPAQDIAVDGWALTMLSSENVGYGSTCNTIGQTLGYFISQVGFLAFNSPDVCNKYFR